MRHPRRRMLHGLCAIAVSLVLLAGSAPTAQGGEVPAEKHSANPAVLHITFGKLAEPENQTEPVLTGNISGPEPEDGFDPLSIPGSGDAPAAPHTANVPEPGTFALLGLGLAALLLRFRRKQ